jgi:hypothetical protein
MYQLVPADHFGLRRTWTLSTIPTVRARGLPLAGCEPAAAPADQQTDSVVVLPAESLREVEAGIKLVLAL